MKKLALLMALILVLSALAMSCVEDGKDPADSTTPDNADTTPTTPVETTTPEETTTEAPVETTTPEPVDTTTTPPETTAVPEIKWTDANQTFYVNVETGWLRTEPSTEDEATKKALVKFGDALECTGTSSQWARISYAGETLYISNSLLIDVNISGSDMEEKDDTVYVDVTNDTLTFRRGPNAGTEALGYFERGTQLHRIGDNGKWSKVEYNGQIGYVRNTYIQTTPVT